MKKKSGRRALKNDNQQTDETHTLGGKRTPEAETITNFFRARSPDLQKQLYMITDKQDVPPFDFSRRS